MSVVLIGIIFSTIFLSLLSFLGALSLLFKARDTARLIHLLVALAAGTLLGDTFLHLMPEGVESMEPSTFFGVVLFSYVVFFLIEKIIHWHHCHEGDCDIHSYGYMSLLGDGIHNFIDGIILAVAFVSSPYLGVITTFAIALHEIPQELGDFAILIKSGFSKKRALFLNFGAALLSVIGGIVGYFAIISANGLVLYLLPLASGALLYISTTDLVPELRFEKSPTEIAENFAMFCLGISLMYALMFFGL
ncbi:ZIP family metal transporter [candidate division WWE3 bacterium]|uniref:ZIP family metal transporter n=1 Tax=candidate division WWE3 bacterium TaxID=2053526 RepID=A0A955EAV9_UNCKA|nr:ZIP family metal transporter [candidate division WWE3 bacterium]